MNIFLEPVDVWLFRDGRPFDAGAHHRAHSVFPPFPTVIQGAVRSHQLSVRKINLSDKRAIKKAVGTADDFLSLALRGPFLAKKQNGTITRYYPQPADAFSVDKAQHKIRPASSPAPCPATLITSEGQDKLLLGFDDDLEKGESGLWLSEADLIAYLQGQDVTGTPADEIFKKDIRPGIAKDSATNVAIQGKLFEVEFVELNQGWGLLVEVNDSQYDIWPASGALKLGGESRAAYYQKVETPTFPSPAHPLPKRFKLYFAAPAYFSEGWRPQSWSQFFDGDVSLVTAAVGRYLSSGGYDTANNTHKPARRYVPAGSVYYFETKNGQTARLKDTPQRAVTQFGEQIGFGQIILQEWTNV
jgi:CRISPR-associated protein Cmr3